MPKSSNEPNQAQVIIRTTPEERDRWKLAAEAEGKSFSEFARDLISQATSEILDCQHPMEQRLVYPWSEFCQKCGLRLRG